MGESYVQVSTTTDQREEADDLADLVVERRLAACAQVVGPITSTYWWKGDRESAEEWLILMKTTGARQEELIEQSRPSTATRHRTSPRSPSWPGTRPIWIGSPPRPNRSKTTFPPSDQRLADPKGGPY